MIIIQMEVRDTTNPWGKIKTDQVLRVKLSSVSSSVKSWNG